MAVGVPKGVVCVCVCLREYPGVTRERPTKHSRGCPPSPPPAALRADTPGLQRPSWTPARWTARCVARPPAAVQSRGVAMPQWAPPQNPIQAHRLATPHLPTTPLRAPPPLPPRCDPAADPPDGGLHQAGGAREGERDPDEGAYAAQGRSSVCRVGDGKGRTGPGALRDRAGATVIGAPMRGRAGYRQACRAFAASPAVISDG